MTPETYQVRYARFLERLKQARIQAKMTQQEVADRLGMVQSYVSKCENGDRRVDIVELEDFARLYRVPLDYFATHLPEK